MGRDRVNVQCYRSCVADSPWWAGGCGAGPVLDQPSDLLCLVRLIFCLGMFSSLVWGLFVAASSCCLGRCFLTVPQAEEARLPLRNSQLWVWNHCASGTDHAWFIPEIDA